MLTTLAPAGKGKAPINELSLDIDISDQVKTVRDHLQALRTHVSSLQTQAATVHAEGQRPADVGLSRLQPSEHGATSDTLAKQIETDSAFFKVAFDQLTERHCLQRFQLFDKVCSFKG